MRQIDFPAFNSGVPNRLKGFLSSAGITLPDGCLFCLHSFLDKEFIYQTELNPEIVDAVVKHLKMDARALNEIPDNFFNHWPYWWNPIVTEQTQAFATESFTFDNRGRDGLHMFILWDPETHLLHAWIKDNF